MIDVVGIRAGYGDDGPDILNQISIHARAREIVAVLGPNGCGKSTLLKCIAGFLKPREGAVRIDGREVGAVPVHEKVQRCGIGFVPQTENVFANLTVIENLRLGARYLPKAQRAARVVSIIEKFPFLSNRGDRKASALSGGERQLLSLGRALVSAPSILLLDEPSAGLSPRAVGEVFATIKDLRDQLNLCIVMVEQNASEALEIADRAYVLSLGTVAVEGSAAEILTDPRMRDLYLGGDVAERPSREAPATKRMTAIR